MFRRYKVPVQFSERVLFFWKETEFRQLFTGTDVILVSYGVIFLVEHPDSTDPNRFNPPLVSIIFGHNFNNESLSSQSSAFRLLK